MKSAMYPLIAAVFVSLLAAGSPAYAGSPPQVAKLAVRIASLDGADRHAPVVVRQFKKKAVASFFRSKDEYKIVLEFTKQNAPYEKSCSLTRTTVVQWDLADCQIRNSEGRKISSGAARLAGLSGIDEVVILTPVLVLRDEMVSGKSTGYVSIASETLENYSIDGWNIHLEIR